MFLDGNVFIFPNHLVRDILVGMSIMFIYLAKTRHLDILYKKSEGKLGVFCIEISVG